MKVKDRVDPKTPTVEPGVYIAVCIYSIDLGKQLCKYNGSKSYKNQVTLGFELIGETVEIDGKQKPRELSRTFNVTSNKKGNLRKFVESWLAKTFTDDAFEEFDTNALVGMPAQLSVKLSETGEYANIDSIMQLPKGRPVPQATSPLICFDLEPWDDAAFEKLPEWAQEKIRKSTQYQKFHMQTELIDVEISGDNDRKEENPI